MAFDAPTRESEEKKENKDLLEVTSDMGSLVEIETKPVVGVKRKSPDLARPRLVPKVSKVLSDDPTPDPGQDWISIYRLIFKYFSNSFNLNSSFTHYLITYTYMILGESLRY